MKLTDLHEIVLYEDHELMLVALDEGGTTSLKVALKGKAGKLIKDVDALAKKGVQKAGIIGAYATDHLKRYKNFKKQSDRSVAFYARNIWEKKAYEKMIKELTKSGTYRVVKTLPYPGGAKMWELRRKK